MPFAKRDKPGLNHYVMPGSPAGPDKILIDPNLVALTTATIVAIAVRQQQHRVTGRMFDAVTAALNGETKAAGVGKFGVFGFAINVVVQFKLASGQHHDMLRMLTMLQDLRSMGDNTFFNQLR